MGVTGLWTVVQPCARPIKIETLNKKRLAVDASIWIYQFLKAVRDKEGNALRNSHVVGFFRRICKLLFIGIKPVFVFDGGAPALKRQTINGRKQRREGRREDATRTAAKLLALQMQRLAEEEEANRRRAHDRDPDPEEDEIPDGNLVYADEVQMTQQERQQNRKFRKKDQYHLPELDMSLAEMSPNDPRIMSLEELEAYAQQFDTGEDINVYDFSKIDFDSPFFTSLPASDRYNILNAARLRSRLRMGYSKEQLDIMFPDRMAFSKFQIERVTERNNLTQRLMNLNGMNDGIMFGPNSGRISGEKGREYVLVRNEGVEGGWALGVVGGNDEGRENKPIDVDKLDKMQQEDEEDWDDDEDFEDVPIEGLNRLPKMPLTSQATNNGGSSVMQRKRAVYNSRRRAPPKRQTAPSAPVEEDPDSLFVADENEIEAEEAMDDAEAANESEDEELQRAIAMSMEQDNDKEDKEDWLDVFEQKRADEARPLPRGRGMAIAHVVNNRAGKVVPAARSASPITATEPTRSTSVSASNQQPKSVAGYDDSDSDSDDMDFQTALAESRRTKHQPKTKAVRPEPSAAAAQAKPVAEPKKSSTFSGPLPFEKLDLGSSLLGRKKMQKLQEESAGGFERADTGQAKKHNAGPLPPWFAGNLDADMAAQRKIEQEDRAKAKSYQENFQFTEFPTLQRNASQDVIDLANTQDESQHEIIQIDLSDDEKEEVTVKKQDREQPKMGDMADAIKAAPLVTDTLANQTVAEAAKPVIPRPVKEIQTTYNSVAQQQDRPAQPIVNASNSDVEDDAFEWEESDREEVDKPHVSAAKVATKPNEVATAPAESPSPDFEEEFEDVGMEGPITTTVDHVDTRPEPVSVEPEEVPRISPPAPAPVSGAADQNLPAEAGQDEFGYYSDSDDEELMRQLAVEAEEHARFASTLNHKTQQQNVDDYERELKQLRTQQKKDRRDADEVTHVMVQECQQLLKLFGLPYITAPMEAEAQCAELVSLGLVDGIVTDDSDCFLFGGTRIYKNMFNQAKYVECYLTSDFEKEFDLTRRKLIGIAHLLGSDYTEGLPGVGPVTALEILSEFPSLTDFKQWFEGVQMNTIPKSVDADNPFRKKFRRQATKLFLPPSFPDPRVENAYLKPDVDDDPSQFQWGVPNLDALRSFLMATIGWSQERTDEVLVPVIKDMNRRIDEGTQSNITAFFEGGTGAGAYAPRKRAEQGSKRMGNALERMAEKAKRKRKGDDVPDVRTSKTSDVAESAEAAPHARKKRAKKGGKRAAATATEED